MVSEENLYCDVLCGSGLFCFCGKICMVKNSVPGSRMQMGNLIKVVEVLCVKIEGSPQIL